LDWDRRANGDLTLTTLLGFEMAVAEGEALAVRVEFAEVQEQLRGEMSPSAKQIVMSLDTAEALGRQLIALAQVSRSPAGEG